ncbi:MAG TPA: hypothetical protein VMS18_29975 [Candidatus Binatia bacterium]|nr:hypothetical protein [Candidatus Binatia bacterium]
MRADVLRTAPWTVAGEHPVARAEETYGEERAQPARWNEETFADEQIRGLVRQVFSPTLKPAVQQVIFCPIEPETEVQSLCNWVGEVLAEERVSEVAVLDESEVGAERSTVDEAGPPLHRTAWVRQFGRRVQGKVWLFPARKVIPDPWGESLGIYLAELRKEFEYTIVAAPALTISSEGLELATLADGVVLVVSAQRTRRVTARKARSALRQARLLGTVLSDREFPIPTSIYRRL